MDRMGRLHYGLQLFVMYLISLAIGYFANPNHLGPSIILGSLLVLPYTLIIIIRRLHDINQSGWLSLPILIIPLAAIILAFIPSTNGKNRFENMTQDLPFSRRIGRLHYSLHIIAIIFIGVFNNLIHDILPEIAILIAIITIIYLFIISIKRFHDMDKDSWWSFLILLPFVSIIIAFIPGTKGPNRFGKV